MQFVASPKDIDEKDRNEMAGAFGRVMLKVSKTLAEGELLEAMNEAPTLNDINTLGAPKKSISYPNLNF